MRAARVGFLVAGAILLTTALLPAATPAPRLIPERRLVAVELASPQVLALVMADYDDHAAPSQLPADYRVNGQAPLQVGRYSATWYEEKCTDWKQQRYPQIIGHRVYLVLPAPLPEDAPCTIEFPGGRTNFTFQSRAFFCESFKVNQVGYALAGMRRAAFYAPWCGDLGAVTNGLPAEVQLHDAATGNVLATLPLRPLPQDPLNGGPLWRVALDTVTNAGRYFLCARGAGRSAEFGVGDVYAHHAFYAHLKGFYQQRCGSALSKPYTEWERAACHTELEVTDAAPPEFIKEHGTRRIPHVGGHHDAGDFDVRLAHTLVAGWLLNAYELFPQKFIDGQLDIPEGNNGIPDLLDEALYSIRAWETLQCDDGGIRAGFEADRHPAYGEVSAATDKLTYRTFARYGHTTLAGAALMAYAGRMIKPFAAERAAELTARAERAWGFFRQHEKDPAYQWSPGVRLFASGQLYLATGKPEYHDVFRREAAYFFNLAGQKSVWPAQYNGTYFNMDTIAKGAAFTHYFASYLLDDSRPKDPEILRAARQSLLAKADEYLKKLSGDGFATISTASWGASTGVGRYGDFLIHAWRLTGDARYRAAAARLADFALGANPPGWCFTSGLGVRPPYNPLHLDSYFMLGAGRGPAPGLVIYGITEPPGKRPHVTAVTQHLYPAMEQLPLARRITDGWSVVLQNEFTIWETMAPNAFLHACLAPDQPLKGRLLPWTGAKLPGGYPAAVK
ncbi:MAG: glycoside hydrolase family 9 protein [Verrucomicrobiota bacterium]